MLNKYHNKSFENAVLNTYSSAKYTQIIHILPIALYCTLTKRLFYNIYAEIIEIRLKFLSNKYFGINSL